MVPVHLVALERLTDIGLRTMAKRLEKAGVQPIGLDGRKKMYSSSEALPAIYGSQGRGGDEDGSADPGLVAERTRLTRINADRKALLLAKEKGELIPADLAEAVWSKMILGCRAKLLALPKRIAPQAVCFRTALELEEAIADGIREALTELAECKFDEKKRGGGKPSKTGGRKVVPVVPTAAEASGKRMGRPGKGAQSGVKRGARKVAHE